MSDQHLLTLTGIYYRMKAAAEAARILAPAHAPEGRFHRDGQRALYLSDTPQGCVVATARYTDANTPSRGIFPLRVCDARVVDLRDDVATAALGIDTTHRAIEWQNLRAKGVPSPTWDLADRVRDLGLDGMLYASRTDPTKTHLTLFRWNEAGTDAVVAQAGAYIAVSNLSPDARLRR
ncbi:RES family NAD+ phosphorylase [Cognatiyoonia sp. IB215446]|uniref:RES family NAD+ phosphorylase n=1 Tax=Cognatiyoonia sp. IB215446 TaxID=3097355 RepID=UPI002A110ED8|nr:RES family NAD+ phosphorylase [Cognatiyoonia sp. IB215446]MDX8347222.1 RES family NAD+ phosphorylase [Cognatiyoonia sp. IB215446]